MPVIMTLVGALLLAAPASAGDDHPPSPALGDCVAPRHGADDAPLDIWVQDIGDGHVGVAIPGPASPGGHDFPYGPGPHGGLGVGWDVNCDCRYNPINCVLEGYMEFLGLNGETYYASYSASSLSVSVIRETNGIDGPQADDVVVIG
jgi:hypothetical protein